MGGVVYKTFPFGFVRLAPVVALAWGTVFFATQSRAQDSGLTVPFVTKAPPIQAISSGLVGDVTVSGTGLAVTNGFSSRAAAELDANVYYSGVGLHFQTVGVWREEDANFTAGGLSYAMTPSITPTFWYGTSTNNLFVEPQNYFRGQVEFKSTPTSNSVGIVATPAITSFQYANGVQELDPQFDIVFYHPAFRDKSYLVTELTGTTIFVRSLSSVGYEVGASETFVMPHFGTIGAQVFGGRMVYDNVLCAMLCGVRNNFAGVRPIVSFYLNNTATWELFFRGEITATQAYDVYGGTIGLKKAF